MTTETIENTFEVESPARLKTSNIRGNIDIQPGEDGIISVTAVKYKGSGSNSMTQINIEQESDGLVVVEAKHENSITSWFGLNKPCRVDFTIQVPKTCSVKLNCVSSSVNINGLEGQIYANCVSGNLKLSNINGNFKLGSVSGKITAENLVGPLDINNVSGKVRISESQISTISGKTVSGSAIIETPLTEGPYEFTSVSGNMSVITPEDTTCTVRLKSVSGKAKINLPVTSRSGMNQKQVIKVAGGGPEVTMKSVSGVLKIGSPTYTKADDELIQSEVEIDSLVELDAPSNTQMQILQKIEEGEISVDEAELIETY